jgi:hypothetical protein
MCPQNSRRSSTTLPEPSSRRRTSIHAHVSQSFSVLAVMLPTWSASARSIRSRTWASTMRRKWPSIANGYACSFIRTQDATIFIPFFLNKGAFDSFEHEHLPRTKYDQIIDEKSNKPGEQAFEVRPRHITSRAFAFFF